jgi:hypothetical protein
MNMGFHAIDRAAAGSSRKKTSMPTKCVPANRRCCPSVAQTDGINEKRQAHRNKKGAVLDN